MSSTIPRWIPAATRAHWRSVRLRIWAAALIAVAGILAFVPLFDSLGFGFSFVMAIAISAASLDLGGALVRQARAALAGPAGSAPGGVPVLRPLLGRAVAVHACLLVPPLIIIAANALRVQNCDWTFGFQALVLMPGLSCAAATAVGMLVGLALPPVRGRRRWLVHALPVLVLPGAVAYSLWRFHATPPVFSYNLFAGYFPGNLYDEQLDFGAAFYAARAAQLAVLTCLLALAAWRLDAASLRLSWRRDTVSAVPAVPRWRTRWRAALTAVLAGGCAALLLGQAGALGFLVDADDIADALGARYDTEHFTIYYPPGGEIERDIHVIAEEHEFRLAQAVRALGAAPSRRITSFYFASPDDKFRWMGARHVYMAKPWRNEIYLHHQSFPHQILRHEIAHVVSAVFGSPIFRVSAGRWLGLPVVVNVGLLEGTAVAADWPDHFTPPLTPHQSVKAMQELGLAPPPERVLSTGFLQFSSARSYTMAGSLVRFLLDTRDTASFHALYRSGGAFEDAYGEPRADVLRDWQAMIDAVELPPRAAETVREQFRQPGIFSRVCPHAISRARVRAIDRWRRGAFDEAIEILRRVCRQAPQEPRYRLELTRYLVAGGQSAQAADVYRELAADHEHISSTLRAEALLGLAAIAARAGDLAEVVRLLDRTLELPIDEDQLRNAVAQRHAATHAGPAGPALRAYFWGGDVRLGVDPLVLLGQAALAVWAEPGLGLGHYLLGRNLTNLGISDEAAASLARSLDLGLHPLVAREAARELAAAAFLASEWPLVEQAAVILTAPAQPEVTRLFGADWRERVQWKRTGALP
jgi:tetratricopeptide (TPR) repeat protein